MVLILTIPNAMLESNAAATTSRLEALPAELISDIFKLANLSSRINLSLTSKFMARVATEAKELEVECDKMSDSSALSLLEDRSVPVTTRPRPTDQWSAYHAMHDTHHGVQFTCRYCKMWSWLASPVEHADRTADNLFYLRHAKHELADHQSGMLTKGYMAVIKSVLSTLIERARKQKERAGFLTLNYRK